MTWTTLKSLGDSQGDPIRLNKHLAILENVFEFTVSKYTRMKLERGNRDQWLTVTKKKHTHTISVNVCKTAIIETDPDKKADRVVHQR